MHAVTGMKFEIKKKSVSKRVANSNPFALPAACSSHSLSFLFFFFFVFRNDRFTMTKQKSNAIITEWCDN